MKTDGLESLLQAAPQVARYVPEPVEVDPEIAIFRGDPKMKRSVLDAFKEEDFDFTRILSPEQNYEDRLEELDRVYGVPRWLSRWVGYMSEETSPAEVGSIFKLLKPGTDSEALLKELEIMRITDYSSPGLFKGPGKEEYHYLAKSSCAALRDDDPEKLFRCREDVKNMPVSSVRERVQIKCAILHAGQGDKHMNLTLDSLFNRAGDRDSEVQDEMRRLDAARKVVEGTS